MPICSIPLILGNLSENYVEMKKTSRIYFYNILLLLLWSVASLAQSEIEKLESSLNHLEGVAQANALNRLAELYLDYSPDQASVYALQAIELSAAQNLLEPKAEAHNNLGLAYHKQKKHNQANNEFNQAIKIAQFNSLLKIEAYSWHNLGKVYIDRKWFTEAKACFQEATNLMERLGLEDAKILTSYGHVYLLSKNYNEALKCFKRANEAVTDKTKKKVRRELAKAFADTYHALGLTEKSNEYMAVYQSLRNGSEKLALRNSNNTNIQTANSKTEKGGTPAANQNKNGSPAKAEKGAEVQGSSSKESLYFKICLGLGALVLVLLYLIYWVKDRYHNTLELQGQRNEEDTQKLRDSNFLLKDEIKKRYQVEKTIMQEKAFLNSLLDSIPDLIYYKDNQGNFLGCNKAYSLYIGKTADELRGRTDYDLLNKEEADDNAEKEQQVVARGRSWRQKHWAENSYGQEVLLDTLKTPFFSPEEESLGLISISRDMTAIKQAEDQIVKLSHAVEQSPVSIVITDTAGNIEYVNPMFSEVTGYSREEVKGENLRILKSGKVDDETYRSMWETISAGRNWNGTFYNRKKNGELYWDNTNISPIIDTNGKTTHYLATKEDITLRKKQEQELLKAKVTAENANRTKSDFLAKMSHEIRTPMHGIIGFTDIMLNAELNQENQGYLKEVRSSANNLMSLINDIFDFSRMESECIELEVIPFKLSETIMEVAGFMGDKLKAKRLELKTHLDPSIPEFLNGDQVRLRQIILNLTNNAIKFTNSGSVEVSAKLLENSNGKVTLQMAVKDTGIGISPAGKRKLFKSFVQGDDTNSRSHGGTGLGLVISKKLVELMGGEISVDSELGKGSTFTFTVCFEVSGTKLPLAGGKNLKLTNLRVLLADDTPLVQNSYKKYLDNWKCRYDIAPTASEAFSKMLKQVGTHKMFNVVIVSNKLPDSDSIVFANTLMNDPSLNHIKMIMLSHNTSGLKKQEMLDLGYFAQIENPQDISELQRELIKISSIIQHKEQKNDGLPQVDQVFAKKRILLVEDNIVNQKVASLNLEKLGVEFDIADNGKIACEKYSQSPFDIVLMDIQMPIMDGYEATDQIREMEKETGNDPSIIIALTANAMRGDREKFLDAGMDEYLSKPFSPEDLKDVLKKFD